MVAHLATLLFGAFFTNVAVAVLPHEPLIILFGKTDGVWVTAAVATIGTLLACVVDRLLFFDLLAKRKLGERSGLLGRIVRGFDRAPFFVLVLSGLTPLPFWPFKLLAFASRYAPAKYYAAICLGRFPRYALLAWLGHALPVQTGWVVTAVTVFVMATLLWRSKGSKMKNEEPAVRVSKSLTRDWEKRNLPKIAAALPKWVTPDKLTGLGIFAAFVIGAGYIAAHWSPYWMLLSIAGLFVHWFGDSLDGTLARVRKIEREKYGYYVDRTADAISTVVIFLAFGLSPYLSLSVALLLAVGYLLIMIYAEVCAYTSGRFPMSFASVGPTEARIILGLCTLALIVWQPPLLVLDALGIAAAVILFTTFVVMSAIEAKRLDQVDRLEMLAKRNEGCESWL